VYAITLMTVALIVAYYMLMQAVTDPTYQRGKTARELAQQQTRQVQAREWGATVRGSVPWLAGGLATAAVFGVGGWMVVEWQRNRTRRHEVTEDHTTQRHLISAKRDIALAYLAQCGDPGAYVGQLNGTRGVFLPMLNEFVPEAVCRAELVQQRMITMEVD